MKKNGVKKMKNEKENVDNEKLEDEKDNNIEVVNGDGTELDISPVYDHLNVEKPNTDKKKGIVVPKTKK